MMCAQEILQAAGEAIGDRAASRDQPSGERSVPRCVRAFNDLTGHQLTERDGWLFMVLLKLARMTTVGGKYNADDYVDGTAYMALAGEQAEAEIFKIRETMERIAEDAVPIEIPPNVQAFAEALARRNDED